MLKQLRCTGVLETIRIRKEGYAVRIPFKEFVIRYHVLSFLLKTQLPTEAKAAADALLRLLRVEAGAYQLGNTKVFLKYQCHAELLRLLEKVRYAGGVVVEAVHKFLNRRRFSHALKALIAAV